MKGKKMTDKSSSSPCRDLRSRLLAHSMNALCLCLAFSSAQADIIALPGDPATNMPRPGQQNRTLFGHAWNWDVADGGVNPFVVTGPNWIVEMGSFQAGMPALENLKMQVVHLPPPPAGAQHANDIPRNPAVGFNTLTLPNLSRPPAGAIVDSAITKNFGHPAKHFDRLAVKASVPAAGNAVVSGAGWHFIPKKKSKRIGRGFGSSNGLSRISFDANSGMLSFHIGAIDILDSDGGLSGGIDRAYTNDPVLGGELSATDIEFLGVEPDGRFKFGGGGVTLSDPLGQFSLQGSFSEYFIVDTTDEVILSSFGLLDELFVMVTAEESGPSLFLQDFIATNMFLEGLEKEDVEFFQGVDFAFVTETNLASATNGFRVSAELPATFILSANIPGPATLPALAIGGLLVGRRRRR